MAHQLSKEAQLAVRTHIKSLITIGLGPEELLKCFHAERANGRCRGSCKKEPMLIVVSEQTPSTLDRTPSSYQDQSHEPATPVLQPAVARKFGCPWCKTHIKLRKDFIRHVEQKCAAKAEFRCFECNKKFTRKSRFKKHHREKHPQHCGSDPCTHDQRARVSLEATKLLRCGFCAKRFDSDLRGFLKHLVIHYKQGAVLGEWQGDLKTPARATSSPPPQVDLSIHPNNDHYQSSFSAFCSGFKIPIEDAPVTSPAAVPSNVYDATINDTMTLSPSVPDLGLDEGHPVGDQSTPYSDTWMNNAMDWNANFPLNEYLQLPTMSEPWIDTSSDMTASTGQCFANTIYQQPSPDFNQFSTVFNATPPLPPVSGKRRSFQNCLLGVFHSLDNFLPN